LRTSLREVCKWHSHPDSGNPRFCGFWLSDRGPGVGHGPQRGEGNQCGDCRPQRARTCGRGQNPGHDHHYPDVARRVHFPGDVRGIVRIGCGRGRFGREVVSAVLMDGISKSSHRKSPVVGVWSSPNIGFTYAPMDRDCKFAEDGTGWLRVAFVGPEQEFCWRPLNSDQIEVWLAEEPDSPRILNITLNGNEIFLTRPDEDNGDGNENVDQLVDAIEFEPMIRVR
jgi:hypothetical protein